MALNQAKIILFWRWSLLVMMFAFLGWLFWQNLVPSGVMVLEHKKGDPGSAIGNLQPERRAIDLPEDGNWQRFYTDPVYFDVRVPRGFRTVEVGLTWQNNSQPIIELGARKVLGGWGYVLKPLQNKVIDDLDWPCQRSGEIIFCQKQKKYENFTAFLSDKPRGKILTYHYDLPEDMASEKMNVATDEADYDFLVAAYTPPQSLGDNWYSQKVVYDWSDFAVHLSEINFLISAPELNKAGGTIVISDLVVTLRRDKLDWGGFMEYVKEQLRRLKK